MANDQPRPSRNSPPKICTELPSGDRLHRASETSRITPPGAEHRLTADPVGQPPDHRREREHAEHVHADHDADDPQVGATVLHVQRRHHHHADHGGVRPGQPDDGPAEHRTLAHRVERAPPGGCTDRAGDRESRRRPRLPAASRASSSGSGRSRTQIDDRGRAPCRRCRARTGRSARGCRPRRRTSPPVRTGSGRATAPMVVAQTTVDSARARRSAVARSVAAYRAPLLAAVVAPSITRPEQEQRHRADHAGRRPAMQAAGGADDVPGHQPDASAAGRHQPRQDVRRHRGTEHLERLGQAGLRVRARTRRGPAATRWRSRW